MREFMLELRSENEIKSAWGGNPDAPLVSICCIAYNHEAFIEKTLHSFLMQETDFPYEILIHDDASTDCTASVIREYEEQYPTIIKVIYQHENQYSKGNKPFEFLEKIAKGKYIATCEGDDYWTDPGKIAKQAKYLNKNEDVVISFHDAVYVNSNDEVIRYTHLNKGFDRDLSQDELLSGIGILPTMTRMYRNLNFGYIPELNKVLNGDRFKSCVLGLYGKAHCHKDIKHSAYRLHEGGVWSKLADIEKRKAQMITYYWLSEYYRRINKEKYSKIFKNEYIKSQAEVFTAPDLFKCFIFKGFINLRKLLVYLRNSVRERIYQQF